MGGLLNAIGLRKIVSVPCVVLAIFTVSSAAFGGAIVAEQQKVEAFRRLGGELGLSLQRSATWKGFAYVSDFDRLANLTKDNVDLCLDYIGNPERTRFERYVAGFSAYKLDISAYAMFIRRILDLHARGIIPIDEVERIFSPTAAIPNVIHDNYDRPEIQSLIKTLLSLPDLDDGTRKWLIFETDHGGYYARFIAWLHYINR